MSNSLTNPKLGKKIKVVIIDDSPLVQKLLTTIFEEEPELEVVGVASDPFEGRELIKIHNPDVITLDIEMPKMDGLTFLKNLMRLRPMPVVMVSSLTQKGAQITLECLAHGAVDFIAKPTSRGHGMVDVKDELVRKVKMAATSNYASLGQKRTMTSTAKIDINNTPAYDEWLIAIGASTGGIIALEEVLKGITKTLPPIVVTQHIPKDFSSSLVQRLNANFPFEVVEGADGLVLKQGMVCIAPGDKHLEITKLGKKWKCQLSDAPPVNNHKPSVDVMFASLQKYDPTKVITVMLSGMGADGARAMEALHKQGSYSIAQDKDTSIVWGMPGAAVEKEATDKELPVAAIAKEIQEFLAKKVKQ